jgi:hypothetical protein
MDEQKAKEQIERFLNGETTNAEEKELYAFFAGTGVPRSLKKYQPMFVWYAGGMKGELPKKQYTSFPLWKKLGIAASVVIVLGVGFGVYHHIDNQKYEYLEGSYIIRNGKKITDIKAILPELRQTNKLAVEQIRRVEKELNFDVDKYMENLEKKTEECDKDNLPIV